MEANEEVCEASVEKSLSMVTSLNPLIGYEKAARRWPKRRSKPARRFASCAWKQKICLWTSSMPPSTLGA